jgi:hypothetical protein
MHQLQAIKRYISLPEQRELHVKINFSDTEIRVIDDIITLLYQFHTVQELLAKERMPTLAYVLPAYDHLLLTLERKKKRSSGINLVHAYDAAIRKIKDYVTRCREISTYGLAVGKSFTFRFSQYSWLLALNPTTKLRWINRHWESEHSEAVRQHLLQKVSTSTIAHW